MEYRDLGKTGLKTSVIGLGMGAIFDMSKNDLQQLISNALDSGVNIADLCNVGGEILTNFAEPIRKHNSHVILQYHIGFTLVDGQQVKTYDTELIDKNFEEVLDAFQSDSVDIGMIHIVDSEDDYEKSFNSEYYEYVLDLKKQGKIKHIGMCSHNPIIALKAVEAGYIDVLMFSINPAYDMERSDVDIDQLMQFEGFSKDKWEVEESRQNLYATCEANGIGITVMKAYAGGNLLSSKTSPLGEALTPVQCLHYALTRPAVTSVMVGCASPKQMHDALYYLNATNEEKKYSNIFTNENKIKITGRCVYCHHCEPCPSGIDIASVTKYLDLSIITGEVKSTVRDHYASLSANAHDCTMCGSCETRCPFGVDIRSNMKKAQEIFK